MEATLPALEELGMDGRDILVMRAEALDPSGMEEVPLMWNFEDESDMEIIFRVLGLTILTGCLVLLAW